MSPSLRKAVAAAIGGGAVAIASVLITGPSGDDGLEGVSYIPYKDIVGVWTVCHGHMAYSRVSTFSGDYLRVTDNEGKTHDVLTGSDDGRHSNTSLAWGVGVQFNPTESVAIDIAYEGSGSGDWRTDGFIVGVGYKF